MFEQEPGHRGHPLLLSPTLVSGAALPFEVGRVPAVGAGQGRRLTGVAVHGVRVQEAGVLPQERLLLGLRLQRTQSTW